MKKMSIALLMDYAPYILILGGVVAASWLLERTASPLSWLMKSASFFGFFVGVLLMVTAAVAYSAPALDVGTRYLLIATGLALILKPVKDVPWAALIALLVGGVCAGYVFLYLSVPGTVFGISSMWIYLAAFFVPALLVYLLLKFIEDVLRLIGTILASKPVAITLGLICIAQGILLLLFDKSLFTIFFG